MGIDRMQRQRQMYFETIIKWGQSSRQCASFTELFLDSSCREGESWHHRLSYDYARFFFHDRNLNISQGVFTLDLINEFRISLCLFKALLVS